MDKTTLINQVRFDYADVMKPLITRFIKTGIVETDNDLRMLIKHYTTLEKLLYSQGDEYYFPWKDALKERNRLLEMKQSRKS